jgi:hypothetical protein
MLLAFILDHNVQKYLKNVDVLMFFVTYLHWYQFSEKTTGKKPSLIFNGKCLRHFSTRCLKNDNSLCKYRKQTMMIQKLQKSLSINNDSLWFLLQDRELTKIDGNKNSAINFWAYRLNDNDQTPGAINLCRARPEPTYQKQTNSSAF